MSKIKHLWPHAPPHHLSESGAYMVTGATLYKRHHFRRRRSLDVLEQALLELCRSYGWKVESWAVFSNHYHFVAQSPSDPRNLRAMLMELHSRTARWINEQDGAGGRRVWYNFRETKLTFQRSYLARLNYVNQNAVKHGLVPVASQYLWCSAPWLERSASDAFQRTLKSFGTARIKIDYAFEPLMEEEEESQSEEDAAVERDLAFERDLG